MSVEARAIRPSEVEECLALWDAAWPEDGRAYFARYFFGDHDFQPEYTRVCVDNGRIVSVAHIVRRTVSCGEFTLTMGGIANVATLPEYRRRGYSSACLTQAIEVMESDAMDFSLLFTGTHALYERLGWERVEMANVVGTVSQASSAAQSRITVRESRAGDDPAIHRIYASFNDARPVTVRRTAPYWREWVRMGEGRAPCPAVVAEDDGAVVGYALYYVDAKEGRTRVLELGAADGASDALEPMLARICAESLAAGAADVELPLSDEPAVREAAGRLLDNVTPVPEESAMVRLLHRDNLLRGLAPALTMRWLEAGGPAGTLTLRTPYGATRIRSASGFLRVEEAEPEGGALSQAALFQLLIGRTAAVELPPGQPRFAEALFPRQAAWYWELDGF